MMKDIQKDGRKLKSLCKSICNIFVSEKKFTCLNIMMIALLQQKILYINMIKYLNQVLQLVKIQIFTNCRTYRWSARSWREWKERGWGRREERRAIAGDPGHGRPASRARPRSVFAFSAACSPLSLALADRR